MSRYIDKDKLINRRDEHYMALGKKYGFDDMYVRGYGEAINDMEDEPEADVQEVRHAKWMTDRFGMERSICSNCRAVYEGGDSFRFCPKCGARMFEEKNNEGN